MTPRHYSVRGLALAGLFLAVLPSQAPAINIWTGNDPNPANGNLWSEPLNWLAGVPIDGDDLFFGAVPGPSTSSLDDISGLSINSIIFTADAPAYRLVIVSGKALTIAGVGD